MAYNMEVYLDYSHSHTGQLKITRSLRLYTCVTNFCNHSIMFISSHLINHQLLQVVQLRIPLIQGRVPCRALTTFIQF